MFFSKIDLVLQEKKDRISFPLMPVEFRVPENIIQSVIGEFSPHCFISTEFISTNIFPWLEWSPTPACHLSAGVKHRQETHYGVQTLLRKSFGV